MIEPNLRHQLKEFGISETTMPTINKTLDEVLRQLVQLRNGFADGDADGHRRFHEALIKREEERSAIRRELISHLVKVSTWSAIVGLAIAAWRYIQIIFGIKS
jgi:hypothetical protein